TNELASANADRRRSWRFVSVCRRFSYRNGPRIRSKLLNAAFRPANRMNLETIAAYQQNILRITRQIKFNPRTEHPTRSSVVGDLKVRDFLARWLLSTEAVQPRSCAGG